MAKIVEINKQQLSTEKVELALIDDLEKEYKKIQQAKDEITKEGKRIDKLIFQFRDVLNNFKTVSYIKLLSNYKNAAKELGVEIDNKFQKALDDYQDEKGKQADRYINR